MRRWRKDDAVPDAAARQGQRLEAPDRQYRRGLAPRSGNCGAVQAHRPLGNDAALCEREDCALARPVQAASAAAGNWVTAGFRLNSPAQPLPRPRKPASPQPPALGQAVRLQMPAHVTRNTVCRAQGVNPGPNPLKLKTRNRIANDVMRPARHRANAHRLLAFRRRDREVALATNLTSNAARRGHRVVTRLSAHAARLAPCGRRAPGPAHGISRARRGCCSRARWVARQFPKRPSAWVRESSLCPFRARLARDGPRSDATTLDASARARTTTRSHRIEPASRRLFLHAAALQRIEKPTAAFMPDNGSISDNNGCSSRYRPATFVA
jgi:hypothetical protein